MIFLQETLETQTRKSSINLNLNSKAYYAKLHIALAFRNLDPHIEAHFCPTSSITKGYTSKSNIIVYILNHQFKRAKILRKYDCLLVPFMPLSTLFLLQINLCFLNTCSYFVSPTYFNACNYPYF